MIVLLMLSLGSLASGMWHAWHGDVVIALLMSVCCVKLMYDAQREVRSWDAEQRRRHGLDPPGGPQP